VQTFSDNLRTSTLWICSRGYAKELNKQKFNNQWQKLDELTGKKRSEDAAKTRTAQDETEALCPLPADTAHTRRRSGSAVKTFF
jgi:hypothetical protein